jgi:hypothetical protein
MPKLHVVVEFIDKNQQPQPFAGMGHWVRQVCEEVSAKDEEAARKAAQERVREREGISDCSAVAVVKKAVQDVRFWKSSTEDQKPAKPVSNRG